LGFENIKQENGGGWRYLLLNKNDDYDAIFRKLIKLYFPGKRLLFQNSLNFSFNLYVFSILYQGESLTRLGRVNDYNLRMLDFQMNYFTRDKFTTLDSYLKKNGLTLKAKPIFFLHLLKDLNKSDSNDINMKVLTDSLPTENKNRSRTLSASSSSDNSVIPTTVEYKKKEKPSKTVQTTTSLTITKKNETKLEVRKCSLYFFILI